ncbi:helicase associated domain-containing protein [Arthrobacter bambusae]
MGEEATGERSFASRDEWELMYRSGLSPEIIARTCNVPVATVNRTLGRRAREDPRLREEHLSNAPATPVDVPTPEWTARLREFRTFLNENGRPPGTAAGSGPAERSLARWLSTQRTLHKQGKLSEDRNRHLDQAGPWRSSYRQDRDERHWQQCLIRLARFRAAAGRWPAWKNPAGEDERQLGTWLHGQRQAASQGRLSGEHREQLDSLVPGWNTWRTAT